MKHVVRMHQLCPINKLITVNKIIALRDHSFRQLLVYIYLPFCTWIFHYIKIFKMPARDRRIAKIAKENKKLALSNHSLTSYFPSAPKQRYTCISFSWRSPTKKFWCSFEYVFFFFFIAKCRNDMRYVFIFKHSERRFRVGNTDIVFYNHMLWMNEVNKFTKKKVLSLSLSSLFVRICRKTCLRSFRPGPTKTRLPSRWS